MRTSGTITVNAPRELVYAFVSDPMRLATCIPGCTDLHEISPGKYSAKLANRVGFISVKFDVVVEIVRAVLNEAIDAGISGSPMGLAGRLEAKAGVRLSDDGSATAVVYDVDLGLTGKLGGLGQPVFKAKSEELARQFGTNLKSALEGRSA